MLKSTGQECQLLVVSGFNHEGHEGARWKTRVDAVRVAECFRASLKCSSEIRLVFLLAFLAAFLCLARGDLLTRPKDVL